MLSTHPNICHNTWSIFFLKFLSLISCKKISTCFILFTYSCSLYIEKNTNKKEKKKLTFIICREVLSFFITYFSKVFPHYLDEVRHCKVHNVMPPSQLQDHIRVQQIIGCEETGSEALPFTFLQEPLQKILRQLRVLGLGCILHGILKQQHYNNKNITRNVWQTAERSAKTHFHSRNTLIVPAQK